MTAIVVYSSENCPRCKVLKSILRKLGMEFSEKNLNDTEVMVEMVMRNVISAPVIQIGDFLFEFKGTAT